MKQNRGIPMVLAVVVLAVVSFLAYDWYYRRPLRAEQNREFVVRKVAYTPDPNPDTIDDIPAEALV